MGQYRRHVFVCTHGEYCPFDGSAEVHRLLKEAVSARGLKSEIRVNKSGCFNQCGHGPMVVIYPDDVWYGQVTPDKVSRIVEEHLAGGRVAADLVYSAPPGAHKNPARMAEIQKARAAAPPPSPKTGEPR